MSLIRFCYDTEGDILNITFGFGKPNQREGFELNDNVVLFVDKENDCPLGLMFISYSKLLKQQSLPLDYLAAMPQEQQGRLIKVLKHELLNPFLTLIEPVNREVRIGNPHVNEMVALA